MTLLWNDHLFSYMNLITRLGWLKIGLNSRVYESTNVQALTMR